MPLYILKVCSETYIATVKKSFLDIVKTSVKSLALTVACLGNSEKKAISPK
jgi:hypothetical protein